MELLPKPNLFFSPFSEGAVLFHQDTRRLTVLNKNAAVIWCLLDEARTEKDLTLALQQKFSLDNRTASADVRTAVRFFWDNNLLQKESDTDTKNFVKDSESVQDNVPTQIITSIPLQYAYKQVFRVPGLILEICSQSKEIDLMIDQAMGHLAGAPEYEPANQLMVLSTQDEDDCWDIYEDKALKFAKVKKDSVLPHLLQLIFDLSSKAMAQYFLFHAAVVTENSRAILLPAHVGSGKTTLAASLAKNGFKFFSDELAVIDVESLQVKPYLMPMSIKSGSVKVISPDYPELESLIAHVRPDGKTVRYLPPPTESMVQANDAASVKAIIFPRYQKSGPNSMTLLTKEEGLQRLVQTCSSDRPLMPQDVKAVLTIMEQCQSFALEYHELNHAVKLIKEKTVEAVKP